MGKRVSVLRFMYETRVYLFGSGPLAGNTRVQGYALHSRLLSSSLTLAFEGRRRQVLLLNELCSLTTEVSSDTVCQW